MLERYASPCRMAYAAASVRLAATILLKICVTWGSDRPEADAELLADLAVRLTSSDKPEYGYLAFRQMLGVFRDPLWTGLELLLKCHDPRLKGAHTEYMGSMQRLAQQ